MGQHLPLEAIGIGESVAYLPRHWQDGDCPGVIALGPLGDRPRRFHALSLHSIT
jgi:hypothetical protein